MHLRRPPPSRLLALVGVLAVLGACQHASSEAPPRGGARTPRAAPPAPSLPVERLSVPSGFRIDVFASDVPDARSLAISPSGTVFVGSRRAGLVRAVLDHDGDHRADEVVTIAEGLVMPNGVAFRDGALWVAEVHRILRFDAIEERLRDRPEPVVVRDDYPTERHHGWKFIAFGPDGWLHVPVGAPCNVCDEPDPYASITRLSVDGRRREIVARGVRNTVGFDWHPDTRELWFTDNGRDLLGDDLPPDELNRAPEAGLHFGFPYCHGRDVADPAFGDRRPCARCRPPAFEFQAHVAALGMRFLRVPSWPERYRGRILVAQHGSWNRSSKVGYRLVTLRVEDGRAGDLEVFVDGWLEGEEAWGRPVDVLERPDGSVLVSDDHAGAIYRISRAESEGAVAPTPAPPAD